MEHVGVIQTDLPPTSKRQAMTVSMLRYAATGSKMHELGLPLIPAAYTKGSRLDPH
jgi:hypothetical protein